MFSQFVVLVHGDIDSCEHEALDDLHSYVDSRLQKLTLLRREASEDMIYLHTPREVVADAHTQTCIVLTNELLDVPQPVVAAIGAVCL